MVGNNPASLAYVKGKQKDCEECGFELKLSHFSEDVSQEEIETEIKGFNLIPSVKGILIQLPLPKHLNKDRLINLISPNKDIDCFCELNLGKLFLNHPMHEPCTPKGIIDLCRYYHIDIQGKNCVIIGRSNIVGKPLAMMLLNEGATVTICHSQTKDLKLHTIAADIIICAVGKPKFLTADMVKEGAIVIDVGINRSEDGKLCGDADFENLKNKVSAITPVPGGVGLMTRAALMKNIAKSINIEC